MKVWMLTGDKGITAKMIGIQCGLIPSNNENSNSILLRLKETSNSEEIRADVQEISAKVKGYGQY